MPRRQSWTDDQLRSAVASSTSIKMTMRTLGISSGGSAHYTIRHRVKELGLDTRHFDSPGALMGSWTDDELRAVVPRSSGYIDVLGRLGIVPCGGIEKRLKRRIALLGISTMHFVRKRGPRGRKGTRWTDEELRKAVAAARSYAETIRASFGSSSFASTCLTSRDEAGTRVECFVRGHRGRSMRCSWLAGGRRRTI